MNRNRTTALERSVITFLLTSLTKFEIRNFPDQKQWHFPSVAGHEGECLAIQILAHTTKHPLRCTNLVKDTKTELCFENPTQFFMFMPPTLKKLMGHIAFGASLSAWVRVCVTLFVPTVTFKPLKLES